MKNICKLPMCQKRHSSLYTENGSLFFNPLESHDSICISNPISEPTSIRLHFEQAAEGKIQRNEMFNFNEVWGFLAIERKQQKKNTLYIYTYCNFNAMRLLVKQFRISSGISTTRWN